MVKLYIQHCFGTVQAKYSDVCSAFYGARGLFPVRVAYSASVCFYKVGQIPNLQGQSGASDSQPVSTFTYLKNLPLMIQMRVLSSVE